MKKLKFKPAAILFDMDGVIVDSMPYHYIAWYEALQPLGIRVSCFDIFLREGEQWQKTLKEFLEYNHIHPESKLMEKIFSRRNKIFKKYFKRFIFYGVQNLLQYFKKQRYPLALVSGTDRKNIRTILPLKIRVLFSCIIGGDSIKYGKPHPESYLTAAKKLGVDPKKCIVIENAPNGIQSAKAAGMYCIAITTSLPEQFLKKSNPDLIVSHFKEIGQLIDSNCQT